jgi:hypothetical protein
MSPSNISFEGLCLLEFTKNITKPPGKITKLA